MAAEADAQFGMMKENLSYEDGKEVMKSTTNVLMMVTPIKYDMSVPGVPSIIINKGASIETKTMIKKGVEYILEDD